MRKKAAEELKKEQERKAAERRRIIEERCGTPKNIDDAGEGKRLYYLKSQFFSHFGDRSKSRHFFHPTRWTKIQRNSVDCDLFIIIIIISIFFFFFIRIETDTVKRVIKEYYERITKLEDQKFDLEYVVKKKDFEVR